MSKKFTVPQIKSKIENYLNDIAGVTLKSASGEQYYKAAAYVLKEILTQKHQEFTISQMSKGKKSVNYLSMEFLMGRSLKTNLFNTGMTEMFKKALGEYGVTLDNLYEYEPDAGLGNGGLGRLAACYMDALATGDKWAFGYCILYEFGIFRQKIVDNWQTEMPDNWLPGGEVWLTPRPELSVDVRFGGETEEFWDNNYHHLRHINYSTVKAVPYDMYVSGYNSEAVSLLRLFKAESPVFDMDSFNRGDYAAADSQRSDAEAISKVLYPNDNHRQGKLLRLRQQYFLCAAAVGDIVRRHLNQYDTLDNFDMKTAIHINDTHPSLAIAELMRILLDDCGYTWEKAWELITKTFAYTNHTVMEEALETWDQELFKNLLPRIYQIIVEISGRLKSEIEEKYGYDSDILKKTEIVRDHKIKMANLSVYASHSVNGVSKLHSDIIKKDVFKEFYAVYPEKFKNVTNGIAYRRWLCQSNPGLTSLLRETIGDGFITDGAELEKFAEFADDKSVLKKLEEVKMQNKLRFADYVTKATGKILNPDSIFDVQVKRLHEYKRQHLNALNIIADYQALLENPNMDFVPKTYIFGAKAAPGYYLAKQIIKLICSLSVEIERHPQIKDKLQIVYLEDYNVSLSELLMPAGEISEQISLAGTEASGTGNMKLMFNGAVTLGTLDGANIEIMDAAGEKNIFIFGMKSDEVDNLRDSGYKPAAYYEQNSVIKNAVDLMCAGIDGSNFDEVASSLRWSDPYMVLADFDSYRAAQAKVSETYQDKAGWNRMSLYNIAGAGVFSADRSVKEYAENIWNLL